MTQQEYLDIQHKNIALAIATGQALLKTSFRLHNTCDSAGRKETYSQDLLMYYDFNDAASNLASMPQTLREFKQQAIDIKIENDRQLLHGGYLPEIDTCITGIFEGGVLDHVTTIEQPVLERIREAIALLEELDRNL